MLQYNFDRVFKARGIDRPFSFLLKAGFSDNFATKVKNNRIKQFRLRDMERLCLALKCLPNDFLIWTPEKEYESDTEHPLNELRKSAEGIDLVQAINSLPFAKMKAINEIIRREIKQ